MTTEELLRFLAESGVDVWRAGDRLRYRAKAGSLTVELRTAIAEHRDALLTRVHQLAAGEAPFGLTAAEVAEFRRLNVAVKLRSAMAGDFWLVPAYTGRDRPEATPEDVGRLWLILKTFPGSIVESFIWLRLARAADAAHPVEETCNDPS